MPLNFALATTALVVLFAPAAASELGVKPAEAAIRQMQDGYIGAWQRSDPAALAANFTDDGDFISPDGHHAVGRTAIAEFYAQAFAIGYRGSGAGFTPRLSRTVAPGVIVIDGEWWISGARQPDGAPRNEERGLATAVLVKTDFGWRITALREQSSATKIS